MSPAANPPAPRVFICYRREETAAHAGRLYDAMVARFGERNVFMDVDIEPGVDFVERITEVVSACQVLIVVMGPSWATVTDETGGARIADPDDFVRLEVETAVRRSEVTPIPVLVSGARMPTRDDLPSELHPITRRNALELSDARWGYDVGRLISTLDGLLTDITGTGPRTPPPAATHGSAPSRLDRRLILEGMLVAGATAFAARYMANAIPALSDSIKGHDAADVVLRRTETWALTGAALAAWLGSKTGRTDFFRLGMIGLLVGAMAGAIGGAIWAVPVLMPDRHLDVANPDAANLIAVGSLAVTGGILGALIGALWRPPQLGAGLAGGAVAGALVQVIVNILGWNKASDPVTVLTFGIAAAAIAGLAFAALLALGRRRSTASSPPAYATAADP